MGAVEALATALHQFSSMLGDFRWFAFPHDFSLPRFSILNLISLSVCTAASLLLVIQPFRIMIGNSSSHVESYLRTPSNYVASSRGRRISTVITSAISFGDDLTSLNPRRHDGGF